MKLPVRWVVMSIRAAKIRLPRFHRFFRGFPICDVFAEGSSFLRLSCPEVWGLVDHSFRSAACFFYTP